MRPILFSEHFKINPASLDEFGLLDPYINIDTPLFVDPLLIDKSSNEIIAGDGIAEFRKYFENLIRLLTICESEGDAAWAASESLLSLNEPAENGLGYGRGERAGSSRPREVRCQLLRTVRQVLKLGSKDPEMLSLMGFLESGVGSDTISDFTTRAMTNSLGKVTNEFCNRVGISVHANSLCNFALPRIDRSGKSKPMVLVPRDVLRDLPVTDSWADVWEATEHNAILRDKLSKMLAGIARPTIEEQKEAVKSAVMQSAATFNSFLRAVKDAATSYDINDDVMGYYALRDYLKNGDPHLKISSYDIKRGPAEINKIVMDAIARFQHHVEAGNLWEQLWAGGQPKRERASQLLFYAVADSYCRAHNIDISAEPNMGGGPVDFKFSDGYYARVLVELKKSTGTVESGYRKQLEKYKRSSETEFGIFVVLDYGRGPHKISRIKRVRDEMISRGQRASDIVVIDARKKKSASML